MSKRRKSITGYLNAVLLLLLFCVLYKIGGSVLMMIAFTLVVGAGAIALSGESLTDVFRRRRRINILTIEELIKLNPYEFEGVVAQVFREQGYVVHQTKKSSDGGKDLVMYKQGQTYYVECKKYAKKNSIGRPLIQKLVGACHPANAIPIFVTTSSFTTGAIHEAERSGVQLIDGNQFIKMIRAIA